MAVQSQWEPFTGDGECIDMVPTPPYYSNLGGPERYGRTVPGNLGGSDHPWHPTALMVGFR